MRYPKIPILLTICRQDGRKGIPYLLLAYAMLNNKHMPFQAVIVGGGHKLNTNKHLAQKLEFTNVSFTGYVEDIKPFIYKAYCFILPSLEEGGGSIAVLEAMAAGLPVIATDIDGIPEDIENGISGILVPPANPHALAAAIEKVLKNPHLAQTLGRNAKKRISKKYSDGHVKRCLKKLLMPFDIAR